MESGEASKRSGVIEADETYVITERVTARTIGTFVREHADLSATLNTDEAQCYRAVGTMFMVGHRSVNHSAHEYAKPDGSHFHTVESVFKRRETA